MKILKVAKIAVISVVAVIVVALITLRFTGLEPQYLDLQQLRAHNMIARPGLWLKGQIVSTPVTDWSFVKDQKHPGESLNTILVETRTPYFIPHSVRVMPEVIDGQLYIRSHQSRMDKKFPYDKSWTADVSRDPRVRLKIGGKLYRATVVLVADRAQAMQVLGRAPETYEKGPNGQAQVVGYDHVFRVFQRGIPEYGSNQPGLSSAGLVPQACP
jgi:hypothetical protein